MKKRQLIFLSFVILTGILFIPTMFTLADCTDPSCPVFPGDSLTNPEGTTIVSLTGNTDDNVLINNGTITGTSSHEGIFGDDGRDYIENNGIVAGSLYGAEGSDTIVNNGLVNDHITGGSGSDTITNNGTVNDYITGGSGSDTITNNGTANSEIYGGPNSDTIVVNGTVHGSVYGGAGDDLIILNGTITGNLFADSGSDHVIIQGGATGTDIYNGCEYDYGYDVLEFDMIIHDYGSYMSAVNEIASSLPSSGSATINGQTFTWENFEELVNNLLFIFAPDQEIFDVEDQGTGLFTVFKDYMLSDSGVVAQIDLSTLPSELFTARQYKNGMDGWVVDAYYISNDYYAYHYQAWQLNIYSPESGLYSDSQILLISHIDGSVILIEREW